MTDTPKWPGDVVAGLVARWNEQAGLKRWIVDDDGDGGFRSKDLGMVLAQLPLGPTGRAVTLLDSGARVRRPGREPLDREDSTAIAWREGGKVHARVIPANTDARPGSDLDLLPRVLTAESYDRFVAEVRGGVDRPGSRRRWVGLWCTSYEELVARLDLVERVTENGLPEQTVPLTMAEREVHWLENELVILRYRSDLLEGVDFRLVARSSGDAVMVLKVLEPWPREDEVRPVLSTFDWAPFVLTPESYQRLWDEAEAMVAAAADEVSPAYEVAWPRMSYEEIEAAPTVAS